MMAKNKIIGEDIEIILRSPINWNRFYGKTILVTGANGFLPAYMVETLLALNEDPLAFVTVIALVRSKDRTEQRFAEYIHSQHLKLIVQDVSEKVLIEDKIDFIIHAASQASPKYYGTDPVGTLQANILGTTHLMQLARINSVESFLFFSSGEVYGEVKDEFVPVHEDYYGYLDPVKVRSCYAESKRMGENICASWHHQYSIPAKIVRPFHTYGPKMLLNDGRVYADFVSDILNGRNIHMKSDGSAQRAFCYLRDATIGFFMVLLEGKPAYPYNVGNPAEECSILNLAKVLCGLYPERNLTVVEVNAEENNTYLKSTLTRNSPDVSRMNALGWFPVVGIEEGFKRTIESYDA